MDILRIDSCPAEDPRFIMPGIEYHQSVVGKDQESTNVMIIPVPVFLKCVCLDLSGFMTISANL